MTREDMTRHPLSSRSPQRIPGYYLHEAMTSTYSQ